MKLYDSFLATAFLVSLPLGVLASWGIGFSLKDFQRIQREALPRVKPSDVQMERLVKVATTGQHYRQVIEGKVQDGEFRAWKRFTDSLDEVIP